MKALKLGKQRKSEYKTLLLIDSLNVFLAMVNILSIILHPTGVLIVQQVSQTTLPGRHLQTEMPQ